MTPFEGLGHSGPPCAGCLSVAGFFAKREPFPGREGFILRAKREVSRETSPSVFNLPVKSVKSVDGMVHVPVWYREACAQGGMYRGRVHLPYTPCTRVGLLFLLLSISA